MVSTLTSARDSTSVRSQTDANIQEAINGRLYRNANLVQTYVTLKLPPSEAIALIRYRENIQDRRVLDLGCGAGRLTTYLRPLTTEYVGLDISTYMLEHCLRTFPEFEFVLGDMRSLTQFEAASFSTIFAVANLFDAVSHEERLDILRDTQRMLAHDGLLIFSTHNRNYLKAGHGPRLSLHRNPVTQLRAIMDYLQASANHRRNRRHHRFETDYALLNDSGNNYETLHYYITREVQARQLAALGFELIDCLDESGRTLRPGDRDELMSSLLYVARKVM